MHRAKAGGFAAVTSERYQYLLGLLFDGELSDDEASELSTAISNSPDLKKDLQDQLVLWDLWAQHQAPERSAAAFLEAWKTRLAAEDGAEVFSNSVLSQLEKPSSPRSLLSKAAVWSAPVAAQLRDAVHWLISSTSRIVFASSMAVAVMACLVWLAIPRTAQAVTLTGEGVCTACILHLTHECHPAIRVKQASTQKVYYIHAKVPNAEWVGDYCSRPIPIVVKGTLNEKPERSDLEIINIKRLPPPPPDPATASDKREMFPF